MKTVAAFAHDQLSGTDIDYYAVQNGACIIGETVSLSIAMPDTSLVSMGTLVAHLIRLHGNEADKNNNLFCAWIMNNFGETNFKASLGGFHQYRYSLWLSDDTDSERCVRRIQANTGGERERFVLYGLRPLRIGERCFPKQRAGASPTRCFLPYSIDAKPVFSASFFSASVSLIPLVLT